MNNYLALLFAIAISSTCCGGDPSPPPIGQHPQRDAGTTITDGSTDTSLADGAGDTTPADTARTDVEDTWNIPGWCGDFDPDKIYLYGQYGFETPGAFALVEVGGNGEGCVGMFSASDYIVLPDGRMMYLEGNAGVDIKQFVPDSLTGGPSTSNGWQYPVNPTEDDLHIETPPCDNESPWVRRFIADPRDGTLWHSCGNDDQYYDSSGNQIDFDGDVPLYIGMDGSVLVSPTGNTLFFQLSIESPSGTRIDIEPPEGTTSHKVVTLRARTSYFAVVAMNDQDEFEYWRIRYSGSMEKINDYALIPDSVTDVGLAYGPKVGLDGTFYVLVRTPAEATNALMAVTETSAEIIYHSDDGSADYWKFDSDPYVGGTFFGLMTGI